MEIIIIIIDTKITNGQCRYIMYARLCMHDYGVSFYMS